MLNNGEILDGHTVQREIDPGEGHFAAIYEVLHQSGVIPVALKIMRNPHMIDQRQRFRQENGILYNLKPHTNIIEPISIVVEKNVDLVYYTMELADFNLKRYVASGNLGNQEKVEIFKDICIGLDHAHDKGYAHRDLHWGNILIKSKSVKLNDFGLAKSFDPLKNLGLSQKPMWGWLVTPPEIKFNCWDSPSDKHYISGDIYALGLMLYSMFASHPLIYAMDLFGKIEVFINNRGVDMNSASETDKQQLYTDWLKSRPTLISLQTYIPEIDALILKLSNIDHSQRYKNIKEVLRDLSNINI